MILYLPKKNYLLSGSADRTINVINLSEGNSIQKLNGHSYSVSSLISLNDETFASGSYEVIKIWSIKEDINVLRL
jgi:WD40 repeat protein